MIDDLRSRSAAEVFEEHLRLAGEHHFEEDIERNVSPDANPQAKRLQAFPIPALQ